MAENDNRRDNERIHRIERVVVNFLSPYQGQKPDCEGEACHTVDISSHGLRIKTLDAIPLGTQLEINIELRGLPGRYFLAGTIRHCVATDDGQYLCGIEISDQINADVMGWRELFDALQ